MADSLLRIPVSGLSFQELHRRVSQLFARQEARLEQVEERQTASFLGLYDQVADEVPGGGTLQRASEYTPGDFFRLSTTGRFTTDLPELSGLDGGPIDQIVALNDGTWALISASQDYLSSVDDDTAEGVITFEQTPQSAPVPGLPADLTNKAYVDGQDAAHVAAPDPHPQYVESGDLAPYARKDEANTFTAYPQTIQSQDQKGRPGVSLETSKGARKAEFYFNEAPSENRVNIIAYPVDGIPGVLYLQNRDPLGTGVSGVVVGDNEAASDNGPGTLTVEVDVWIKDQVSLADIANKIRNGVWAEIYAENIFRRDNQRIRSQGAGSRPAWGIEAADGSIAWEASFNEDSNAVNMLAYAGRVYQIQRGAAAGVEVGAPTLNAGAGELSVEGKVYAEGEALMKAVDALEVFSFAAYGGLALSAPAAGAGIGLAWETVQFDTLAPSTPRGVTVDVGANTLAFAYDGVYSFSFSINVTHDSNQQGREFQLRFYNVTAAAAIGSPITVTTGRNSDGSHMALTTLLEISEAEKNQAIRMEVGNSADTYLTVVWDVAEMNAHAISEWREPLPSDAP